MLWLIRSLLVIGRQPNLSTSGLVLPMVTVMMLVVVLLTTALMIRSFERSKNASNVRKQTIINAAIPAIARAKAKIDELLLDPTLPQETPSDRRLYNAIAINPKYTLGDETRLKLAFDIDGNGIQTSNTLENDETLTTAWRFPVDTDNNGKFDSFTLYGIYFRSPSRVTSGRERGKFDRPRNPLESRMAPRDKAIASRCATAIATSSNLVSDSSWYNSASQLKKSFFVYTTTVPITDKTGLGEQYETSTGNTGFSTLEYQQDRSRIPLNNNAVWFNNDLELTPSSDFRLNGRVHTNGNLLVGGRSNTSVRLYQISSKNSCFYQEENSKITVGGNVGTGNIADTADQNAVTVDLFDDNPDNSNPQISSTNKSTNSAGGSQVAYNDAAYNHRIALMKQTALSYCTEGGNFCSATNPPQKSTVLAITKYPDEVKNRFAERVTGNTSLNTYNVLAEEISLYLKNRTRRVPYAEISTLDSTDAKRPYDSDGDNIDTNVFAGTTIEPLASWREPTDANTGLDLRTHQLEATWQSQQDGKETRLGDRILVGNNLPAFWKDTNGVYVTAPKDYQLIAGINWTSTDKPRYRSTQVQKIDDIGTSYRDGFWEEKAAENPSNPLANIGGLRIITGAGIYKHDRNPAPATGALSIKSFLPEPQPEPGVTPGNAPLLAGESTATRYTLVWPDTMPMKGGVNAAGNDITAPPDLRMRATAVYHYKQSSGSNQVPIACVSSYYDATNETTAKNGKYGTDNGLPWGPNGTNLPANPANPGNGGRSNNGVVYPAPYTTDAGRGSAIATYLLELKAQAKMKFPSGRIVNEPLQNALKKLTSSGTLADTSKPLSLSENSAIDTAICSLKILDGTIGSPSNSVIPHGAIKEASFLDGRQVKALSQSPTSTNYDLDLEVRQPLEIRVTEINLHTDNTRGLTRKSLFGTNEYLLPNSGIIYASRDDALRDASDISNESALLSLTDFKLDSTRRPNGIRLINGSNLSRTADNSYREEEKGLILVTNLPVYVKGDFNLHRTPGGNTDIEEFTDTLASNWSNFYTRALALNLNFACRAGRIGCPTSGGDTWRSATIISDAITLLSGTFQDGFREQGDFDLRNNSGSGAVDYDVISVKEARRRNGFFDNNFATSANWTNATTGYPAVINSYVTNGVTPIQRRINRPEYVMEICRKLPVETCGSNDWVVGYDNDGDGNLEGAELTVKAQDLIPGTAEVAKLGAGTTFRAALQAADGRYARRVAFLRNSGSTTVSDNSGAVSQGPVGTLVLARDRTPVPLGINSNRVNYYPYSNLTINSNSYTAYSNSNRPQSQNTALWFRTTNNTTDPTQVSNSQLGENYPLAYQAPLSGTVAEEQPLLVPVLQIHSPEGDTLANGDILNRWIQAAQTTTTFNAGFVAGNSPSRPEEESAGLDNFVRFLENWQGTTVNIKGSFIQLWRSAYATAPFATILRDTATAIATATDNLSLFDYDINTYKTDNGTPGGTLPYYHAPHRQWGFDVALLSQSPDLFAQRFTTLPVGSPNEFFREVTRDDPWIQALMCAATASDKVGGRGATYTTPAIPNRSTTCPSLSSYPANPL